MPEIHVYAAEGRSLDQKRQLVKDITDAVVRNFVVPPKWLSYRSSKLQRRPSPGAEYFSARCRPSRNFKGCCSTWDVVVVRKPNNAVLSVSMKKMTLVMNLRTAQAFDRLPRGRAGRSSQTAIVFAAFYLLLSSSALAQRLDPVTEWATNASYTTGFHPNIVYQKTGSMDLRLDIIAGGPVPAGPSGRPVLIFFHGGGWVAGAKEGSLLKTLPYLARGIDVVNVDYRLAFASARSRCCGRRPLCPALGGSARQRIRFRHQ